MVYYEYTYDSSALAHRYGLRNVLVTAGYINRNPLRRLCKVADAANCDLKAFDDDFYRENCGGELKPVLDSLVTFREEGVWLEITNLIIPTLNDDPKLIRRMCKWILEHLGPDTPIHFSRFHPQYRMKNLPATPAETLTRARAEAMEIGLRYVYVGNVWGGEAESTRCPHDDTLLIRRTGYRIEENNLVDGRCPACGQEIAGVWS
jgi:pyruvate formate lyase activating enzyme